jgi:hypothetical protein
MARAGSVGSREAIGPGRDLGTVIAGGLVGFGLMSLFVRIDDGSRLDIPATQTLQRWDGPRIRHVME